MDAHLANQTKFTRKGVRNMTNNKPYRTAAQKVAARETAVKIHGTWHSIAPRSFHKIVK
ncbi:hypothetical protein [Stappia phage SI01]|uniref:Uncharacterized protein n=1 Tax=Stappia phage SI01 TaxID=2847766 RepID=A0AAE7VIV3_9CAUD|nr:hypothetical protein [Stappia phage SI01]